MPKRDDTKGFFDVNKNVYKKRCRDCNEFKPESEFYKHPTNSDGLSSLCKDCQKSDSKRRYEFNPEPTKERARNRNITLRHDARHKLCRSLERINARAKDTDVICSLTLDYLHGLYIAQNGLCKLTGRLMTLGDAENGMATRDAMSIDRIKPELGYIEGNVQLTTLQANIAKYKFDDMELLTFCRAVLDQFETNADSWGTAPEVNGTGSPTRVGTVRRSYIARSIRNTEQLTILDVDDI